MHRHARCQIDDERQAEGDVSSLVARANVRVLRRDRRTQRLEQQRGLDPSLAGVVRPGPRREIAAAADVAPADMDDVA
jgi:hypothetical protein